jgi:hypothetical protein
LGEISSGENNRGKKQIYDHTLKSKNGIAYTHIPFLYEAIFYLFK